MTRVLVVDDSAVVRRLFARELARDPEIEVVGTAGDAWQARDAIVRWTPDVLTLDVEMPRMDGITFLRRLMEHHPMPVVVVSSTTERGGERAVEALAAGAVDVLPKPADDLRRPELSAPLRSAVRAAGRALPQRCGARALFAPPTGYTERIATLVRPLVALGASTGGPAALSAVLAGFPAGGPAVLVVQHMPSPFTVAFARRLDALCALSVREAPDGDEVRAGTALIAPGGRHLVLDASGGTWRVRVRDGPPVRLHRPSVDVLLRSVAREAGPRAVGAVLTGMGDDGAAGLAELRATGAPTLVQDPAGCVVHGMPRAALRADAVDEVVPLAHLAARIARLVEGGTPAASPCERSGNDAHGHPGSCGAGPF